LNFLRGGVPIGADWDHGRNQSFKPIQCSSQYRGWGPTWGRFTLEAERYRYQKYLSDIAGQDIRQHCNDPAKAVGAVRDWLAVSRSKSAKRLPGATAIMRHYSEFQANLPAMLRATDLEPAELGFFDRANLMAQFLETRATLATG